MRVLVLGMETHVYDSCIRGHHVSKDLWTPVINEELVCAQESGNSHDSYAVAITHRIYGCSSFEAGPLIRNPPSLESMV